MTNDTETAKPNGQGQRILGLDFFRTLAIVEVTLFHMFSDKLPGTFFGVPLFFVLSGYLLAYTSERARIESRFNLINYYWKRFKRIYPSLIIVILTTIGAYHFLAPKVMEAVRPEIISVVLGYNNWWQIEQNADYFARLNNNTPFTHLWFLGVELQYYLIWPVLFLIYAILTNVGGKKFGLAFMTILALAAAVEMPVMQQYFNADISRLYYGTDTRSHALLFGAVLGLAHAGRESNIKSSSIANIFKYLVFFVGLVVTLASIKLVNGQSFTVYQGGMAAMTLLLAARATKSIWATDSTKSTLTTTPNAAARRLTSTKVAQIFTA